eukprot:9522661-Lingulodinium_polyedra.AAC.1
MTLQVDESLGQFPSWLPGLKALVNLLAVADHRRRFVATCIMPSASRDAAFESQFRTGLPNIAHWRWGIITKMLKPLKRLKFPLQRTWDQAAYMRGAACSQATGADDVDCGLLTRTIRS